MIVRNYLFCAALSLFSHGSLAQSLPPAPPAYVQAAEQQLVTQVNLLTTQVILLTTRSNANAKAVHDFTACTAGAPAYLLKIKGLTDKWPPEYDTQGGITQALTYLSRNPLAPSNNPPDQLTLRTLGQMDGMQRPDWFQTVGASFGFAASLVIGMQMLCAAELAKSFK